MKVLVVDHKTFLAELVKLALEADGHVCHAATSVDEASEILRKVRIDVVVLDPETDDQGTFRWIEQATLGDPELNGRVFVLADRRLGHDEAARVTACGARVIRKPFTLQQMRETVSMIVPLGGKSPDRHDRGPAVET